MNFNSKNVLILVLGCAVFFCGCRKKNPEQEKMTQELASVKTELAAAREQAAELKMELEAAQQEAESLKLAIAEEQISQEAAQAESTNTNEISSTDVDKLRAEIKTLLEERDLLRRKVKMLTTQKNNVTAAPKTPSPSTIDSPKQQTAPPKTATQPQQDIKPAEKPQAAPSASQTKDAQLAQKLLDAQSYVQSGNWQAAERLMMEIRTEDPNYPGISELASQIQNVKARLMTPGTPGMPGSTH